MTETTQLSTQERMIAYRKLKAKADALKAEMEAIRLAVKAEVEANGDWSDGEGYAKLVTRRESVSYNNQGLEAVYQSVAGLRNVLDPHREIKPGYTYLQVK